jgi:hypothetical protein
MRWGGQTQVLKIGLNHFCGAIFFKAKLGMHVEIPPKSDQFIAVRFDLFRYLNVHVSLAP